MSKKPVAKKKKQDRVVLNPPLEGGANLQNEASLTELAGAPLRRAGTGAQSMISQRRRFKNQQSKFSDGQPSTAEPERPKIRMEGRLTKLEALELPLRFRRP